MQIKEAVEKGLPLKDVLVIDAHAHLGATVDGWMYIPTPDIDTMIRLMDKMGVDQICASAILAFPDYTRGNDLTAEAVKKYPDRFVGLAVVNPHYAEDVRPELERCFDRLGMRGIKIHPTSNDYPVDGEGYQEVWKFASERKTFVLSHTWHGTSTCNPGKFVSIANKYPDVSFILGHSGGQAKGYQEAIKAVKECPNLYLDLTGSLITGTWVERMVEAVGAERIVYGTDFPFIDPFYEFGKVCYANIDEESKKKILGLNMAKIIRKLS